MKQALKQCIRLLMVVSVLWLSACASTQQNQRVAKIDPLEPMNRAVFSFNEKLDDYVVKPVAQAYKFVLPQVVRTGISNFFSNIGDVFVAVNNLLQGKPKDAASDVGRVLVNTTVGVLGLIDVASDAGLEKHKEDFGQTLGVWGVSDGPYLVLPVLGPSNFRDTVGEALDIKTDLVQADKHLNVDTKNELTVLRIVNRRANLLDATQLIDEAAFDKYSFTRDSYLQRRRNAIYDGNPPPLSDD
jgi:phospholipid-binding lipoprotein MlaA